MLYVGSMPTVLQKISRVKALIFQIAMIDTELNQIISPEMKVSPNLESQFFVELKEVMGNIRFKTSFGMVLLLAHRLKNKK